MSGNFEKRLQPRMELNGYTADIIQGGSVYTATVYDASLEGIQLHDLPSRFSAVKNEKFTIVVSNLFDSTHYKLIVHSQWSKNIYGSVVVGFHVVNAPMIWGQLINKIMSDNEFEMLGEPALDQYVSARA